MAIEWYGTGCGFGGMGYFGWVWMFLVWGAIIWFFIWAIRRMQETSGEKESPRKILQTRYAKGELTKKEYERMKRELR